MAHSCVRHVQLLVLEMACCVSLALLGFYSLSGPVVSWHIYIPIYIPLEARHAIFPFQFITSQSFQLHDHCILSCCSPRLCFPASFSLCSYDISPYSLCVWRKNAVEPRIVFLDETSKEHRPQTLEATLDIAHNSPFFSRCRLMQSWLSLA